MLKLITKEQARNLLLDTRIEVEEDSAFIQKLAFKAGFRWGKYPYRDVKNLSKPFLFFEKSKKGNFLICCTDDVNKFNNSSRKLINIKDLYDIEVSNPTKYYNTEGRTIAVINEIDDDDEFEW